MLGYAWLSSSTLRTAIRRFHRYQHIVGERGATEVEEVSDGLKIRFWAKRGDPATVAVAAVIIDIFMSILVSMCRLNAGPECSPIAVNLRRREPENAGVYADFFGCPVHFCASENSIVLDTHAVDRLLPTSNRQLAAVLDGMLAEELARLDKSDIVARCRFAVLDSLTSGAITEEDAAAHLHMSARTLQRKLGEAELTYQQLVDDTRKDLAMRYIADPARSLIDITFSLGFSQPSAFTRAFKRWSGLTPREYRRQQRSNLST